MKPPYLSIKPLIRWQTAERPFPWESCFPEAARIHVEIGFGLGDFLVRQANEHPDWGIVGLEMGWFAIRQTLRKIALAGIKNVRLIQMDAREAFLRLFEEQTITSVDSLFPCPWPKTRHLKHRLFSRGFLKSLNGRLVSGGRIRIVTDHKDYFEWIRMEAHHTGLEVSGKTVPPQFTTKYEQKWMGLGMDRFFELTLVKQRHMTVPLKEEPTVKTHRIAFFNHKNFAPSGARDGIIVEFKDYLFDEARQRGMIRAVVLEDGFKQDFWLEVQKREHHWHIHPAKGCSIIPSAGVQRALDLVKEAAAQPFSRSR
jgi:tRNA (guanine-N7-)-methyltransferase